MKKTEKTELTKDYIVKELKADLRTRFRVDVEDATPHQIYISISEVVKEAIIDHWMDTQKKLNSESPKIVYYLSMEFLTGRYLGNNILSLSAYPEVKEALKEIGYDLNAIEDEERDPALGNGGLGRLAACFLDSLSTLGYPAYGCGIRYHYGMFAQKIENGAQVETPDRWLKDGMYPFELKRPEYAKEIRFGGTVEIGYDEKTGRNTFAQKDYESVRAVPYDLPIIGYGNGCVNTLRIWDAEAINDFRIDEFDKGEYLKAVEQEGLARNLVEVLYPNDNHMRGKELRLKQQYFFVSASLHTAIVKFKLNNKDMRDLPKKVVFQMNDTHPSIAVGELMRILLDEEDMLWDDAWEITKNTCAYTNHTIMSEALEKWPIDLFKRLLPRVYMIIDEINRRFVEEIRSRYPGDESKVNSMAVLVDGQVRMANLAIVGSFSVNGVAALHTEILKTSLLRDFYEMMPEKFSNKTNGITQRRFMLHGDPEMAKWITELIGSGWITDLSEMKKLMKFVDDKKILSQFRNIKKHNKKVLADYIKEHNGIDVDVNSIFDVQVKRLHEYKRQLLNILHVIYLYLKLKKNPGMEFCPQTYIFGAKASAGYERAKSIIRLINSVAEVVNSDPDVNGKLKVVFIEDYRVSNAEVIFAAADVSEQISTAGKEASGTGNMKFMLNGAITLGTLDGANVEIVEEVGEENAVIFGMKADEIMNYERNGGYDPRGIASNDWELNEVLGKLVDGTFKNGDGACFNDLYDSLLSRDEYFIIGDFRSYVQAHEKIVEMYENKDKWAKCALSNIACCGKFSSDRTIEDYVRDIWKLKRIYDKI